MLKPITPIYYKNPACRAEFSFSAILKIKRYLNIFMKFLWIFAFLVVLVLPGCSSPFSYEGMTAKEWFGEYQEARSEIRQKGYEIDDLQDELETSQDELQNLQDEFQSLEDEYSDLHSCVEDYPYNAAQNCI